MKLRNAFTMIELIFVIVVIAILSKFGTEFLAQSYNSFISTKVNNELQANSQYAVEFIAKRLQYRIKDSIIARRDNGTFDALPSVDPATASTYTILEWVGSDIDNLRGDRNTSNWSGIIDLDASSANTLVSPDTNTTALNNLIQILSDTNATINTSAIYFVGANTDIQTGYGWDGNMTAINAQQGAMHPIASVVGDITQFQSNSTTGANFTGVDLFEYYQLAWSAYAIRIENYNATTNVGNLALYYDYQPWRGESWNSNTTKKTIIMNNVSTFQSIGIGSVVKIQVCTKSRLLQDEEYSLCKEKTIF
jgi:prepilin-type N-terminal cleavage/methylation domain-containing protein